MADVGKKSVKLISELNELAREDPDWFMTDILGVEPWSKQTEILDKINKNKKTSVRSCNGAGKTFFLPRVALWYLHAYAPAIVINTAPTWRQVENQYWKHFRQAHADSEFLGGKVFKTKYEITEEWYALGISVKKTEDFQGWHGKNIMVIVDEASGVSPMVYEAINGVISGGLNSKLVLIGNPNQNQGDFYDSFTDDTFAHVHISAYDLPNVKEQKTVIPGLSNFEWVEDMKKKYGVDHDVFRVRCLGEPPIFGDNVLIPINLVADSIDAEREEYGDDEWIGVDVARYGSDNSAFVYRKGNKAKVLEIIPRNDLMELAGICKRYLKDYPKAKMMIDLGMGAGVYDRLKELDDVADRVYGANFGAEPVDKEDYLNMRAESWSNIKAFLRDGILEDHNDWYQLCKPKYKITSKGQIQLESKEEMKKRGVSSPDVGDALALTMCKASEGGDNLGVVWID